MHSFKFFGFGFLLLVSVIMVVITALPHEEISKTPAHRQQARWESDPTIAGRPEGVGEDTFHGSQFQFFDELGFVKGSPGVEAAPVFLYARTIERMVFYPPPIIMTRRRNTERYQNRIHAIQRAQSSSDQIPRNRIPDRVTNVERGVQIRGQIALTRAPTMAVGDSTAKMLELIAGDDD